MKLLDLCSKRIIDENLDTFNNLYIICDKEHILLAQGICNIFISNGLKSYYRIIDTPQNTKDAFQESLLLCMQTLVLVGTAAFSGLHLYKWLDFTHGTPIISSLNSKSFINVMPVDSTYRVYGSDIHKDTLAKKSLLNTLKPNTNYKISSDNGTELYFTSRSWLEYENEILTAPIENSINGTIVVDAALFFQKVESPITFEIVNGKIHSIYSDDSESFKLIDMYKKMTEEPFKNDINKQLAEIGIGCNTGVEISNCFMESEMLYGTCHFCFGNNECYGGDNPSDFHGASVLIKNPRFEVL